MNYITTNIRLPEEDYIKLKKEANRERKSLAAVIREKIKDPNKTVRSEEEIEKLLAENKKSAVRLGKKLKGFDSLKALREMRYEGKW